jgi:hypothetical protein
MLHYQTKPVQFTVTGKLGGINKKDGDFSLSHWPNVILSYGHQGLRIYITE